MAIMIVIYYDVNLLIDLFFVNVKFNRMLLSRQQDFTN